jgi:hypothetical protein
MNSINFINKTLIFHVVLTAPNCTAASTDLFFSLQRRRVAWGATRQVPFLIMYSAFEKQRKHKYSKKQCCHSAKW